jgi:nitrate reductase delta subunit
MGTYGTLAESLRYPAPGRLAALERALAAMPAGPGKNAFAAFIRRIRPLSLGEWEELHTRTLDLTPLFAPYIGYQAWGESYARGNFMAAMNRALQDSAIELDGELPDHLVPALRYLEACPQPIAALGEALRPAVEKMRAALQKSDPENPYLHLLEAVALSL